jgi:septum formation protein
MMHTLAAGIQGLAGSFVQRIDGCFFNVKGFPLYAFGVELGKLIESGAVPL